MRHAATVATQTSETCMRRNDTSCLAQEQSPSLPKSERTWRDARDCCRVPSEEPAHALGPPDGDHGAPDAAIVRAPPVHARHLHEQLCPVERRDGSLRYSARQRAGRENAQTGERNCRDRWGRCGQSLATWSRQRRHCSGAGRRTLHKQVDATPAPCPRSLWYGQALTIERWTRSGASRVILDASIIHCSPTCCSSPEDLRECVAASNTACMCSCERCGTVEHSRLTVLRAGTTAGPRCAS
jgi:hypothetical protein